MKAPAPGSTEEVLDQFYWDHRPCCAGCDWWGFHNAVWGECTRNAPVAAAERWAMTGITACSLPLEAGHIVTRRDHVCGEFKDEFDWSSLPIFYRKRVGCDLP